jgi:hypothetical protein
MHPHSSNLGASFAVDMYYYYGIYVEGGIND